ncbi:hypothetical protein Hdeb2414_s0006g00220301 [Helianthus debilis subsp. tardiflorus]
MELVKDPHIKGLIAENSVIHHSLSLFNYCYNHLSFVFLKRLVFWLSVLGNHCWRLVVQICLDLCI